MSEHKEISADVKVSFEPGGITAWGSEDNSGTLTVYIRTRVDFYGPNLQAVIDTLQGLDPDKVEQVTAGAVSSGLVELLGPDVIEGGVYVQD